ncbi:MAG: threonine ammonia-lyase IlvA [Candidatus Gracilibacteria bacterium]|nr:threonine ammonia-lyase IlvA [Candidatus Gracilibacteria bacterium]
MKIKLKNIIKAKHDFGHFINTTPLVYSERLSKKYEANIYLKREDLQPVRSYKIRGAFNLINSLSKKEKDAGVVCASAGNHAQGVAITCNHLKIKGTIFMPITTPEQKVYKTKQFGGKYIDVVLVGDTFDEAFKASKNFEKKNGSTFVHPFDDDRIITGQATIGLEIYDEMENNPDFIICPIGGGGVVSGMICVTRDLDKKTKIIGVEPAGALSMKTSIKNGKNTTLDKIDIFVDGASVARVGDKTYEIAKEYDLEIIPCPENRVCSTILEYLKEDGYVIEPAGALSTDALKDLKDEIKGKTVVLIVSGGNFDFERLQEVKERSMRYEGLKRYFIISFPQRPGALKDFLGCLGENDDIARFEYLKKSNKNRAPVFIGIETNDKNNWEKIIKKMEKLGFKHHDVTNDELYFDLLV